MSRVEQLREELGHLTEVLGAYETSAEEWSAEWMGRQSLLTRQAELLDELEIAEGDFEFEVSLSGGAVVGHTVRASFLGDFLAELQATLAAAAQTIMHGERQRGRLAEDVLGASQLRIVATAPGSFRVGLEGPQRSRQIALEVDDIEEPPAPFDDAVDRLLDVLAAAETDVTGDRLTDAIGDLGGKRALGHLVKMAKAMATTGTSATLVRRFPSDDPVRRASLTSGAAARLQQVLSRTEQEIDYLTVVGTLTGVRWKTGLFDLEAEGDDGREVYSGRVIRDLREAIRYAFDRPVQVVLERTMTRSKIEGQEAVTYRLVAVEPAEQ